jgi:hypothetical protein
MEECLKYKFCSTPQTTITGLLSPVDSNGNCSHGGTPQSLFEWKKSKWIGGKLVRTDWRKRESIQANTIKKTIDFQLLQQSVSYSSSLSLKTGLQNQVWKKVFFFLNCF